MSDLHVPLSVPFLNGREWEYVKQCLDTNWVSSSGAFVEAFESNLADYLEVDYAVSVMSGTAGLHVALIAMGVGQGDAVLIPDLTFVASANSVSYTGAEAVFVDINPRTYQIDLDLLAEYLTSALKRGGGRLVTEAGSTIKAIMPVHVFGGMCNMQRVKELAELYGLYVIEDATEALGSKYQDKHAGSHGDCSVFSFNGNKIITTGGGGMVVTMNKKLANRLRHLTTQAKTDPNGYFHDQVGYNYRMVNVLAAIGVAQLENLDLVLTKKRNIHSNYVKAFEAKHGIELQEYGADVQSNYWLVSATVEKSHLLIERLFSHNIQARPFWNPMHTLPFHSNNVFVTTNKYSEQVFNSSISFPSSPQLNTEMQELVIKVTLGHLAKGL